MIDLIVIEQWTIVASNEDYIWESNFEFTN